MLILHIANSCCVVVVVVVMLNELWSEHCAVSCFHTKVSGVDQTLGHVCYATAAAKHGGA